MKLIIENRQQKHKIRRDSVLKLSLYLAGFAENSKRANTPFYDCITVILTRDSGMRNIHLKTMGSRSTTDVITIPYIQLPNGTNEAELIVNVQMAVRLFNSGNTPEEVRKDIKWTSAHELALYIAHGFDHLSGFEDKTPAGYLSMRTRELEWVYSASEKGLLKNIL